MLTLAILAGGKSQRMGHNKSIIKFQGEAIIRRILNRLAGLADEEIIIAPRLQEYITLGAKIAPDLFPGRGPLGGLYTALSVASYPAIATVACDMPFVNMKLLAHQRDILYSYDWDVVVPSSEKGLEPLHAIYKRETCLIAVKKALDVGEERLISWFTHVKVYTIIPEETRQFDPRGLMFLNVNTPKDLKQAEKLDNEDIN